MVQDAKSVASETAKKVEREAAAAGEQVKHQAADAVQAVKQRTYEATERAKQSGRQYAEQKKKVAADEIGVFSGAIRKASSKLHEEQHDSIASYLDAAAEQLDRMRDSLQHKSVSQLLEDVSSLARRRPDLVYGGMFLAGLAAVRMLKASSTANSARNRMTPGSQMSSLSEPASGASRPSAYSPLSQSGAIHRDSGFPSPEPTSTPYSPGMGEIR